MSSTNDLFGGDAPAESAKLAAAMANAPLAERMRPQSLDDIIGQAHLVGAGKPLRLAFDSGQPHSMIFWGPPGVGKTTLARLMANAFAADFIALSAVLSGVKEIREAVVRAEMTQRQGKRTILFVDEVHRFNKSQQDAFLPYVESGLFTFIGATTENPSFEVNAALLSRASVYVLQPLTAADLQKLSRRAQETALAGLAIDAQAEERLIGVADGDARKLLNLLEQMQTAARVAGVATVDGEFVNNTLAQQLRRFDKGGDAFYDQISALHKSVRGSNPDAALYWLVRMLDGGADARYLARRIVRMAWEDIGLADPRAMQLANEAAATYERLGSPEGELALAQTVIYLACAPKSNAGYAAYNAARAFVANDQSRPVPVHLRNAPTKLMKDLGYGKDYRYAHDEAGGYAAGENYFPEGMPAVDWYQPTARGLEIKIGEKLAQLKALDRGVASKKEDNQE
jgi:putative ATPase